VDFRYQNGGVLCILGGIIFHLDVCFTHTKNNVFGLMIRIRSRSTQPCIPPGSLNRVPASAGVKAGKSPLPGGR